MCAFPVTVDPPISFPLVHCVQARFFTSAFILIRKKDWKKSLRRNYHAFLRLLCFAFHLREPVVVDQCTSLMHVSPALKQEAFNVFVKFYKVISFKLFEV